MHPTVTQYAAALEELSVDSKESAGTLARNFSGWLKRRGEGKKLALIVEALEKRAALASGTCLVTVVTAHEPSEEMRALLLKKAEGLFPGKKIVLSYAVDAAVIGGARFYTEETAYDATLAATVTSLKKALSHI